MKQTGLTPRESQLLDFIKAYVGEKGIPPSFDEMKDALDLRSKSGIHRLVKALEERGHISRLKNRARAIEIPGSLVLSATYDELSWLRWAARKLGSTPEAFALFASVAKARQLYAEHRAEEASAEQRSTAA